MTALVVALCRELQAGESVADPAVWKNRQQLINALLTIVGALSPLFAKIGLSADDLLTIVTAVVIIGGVINGYFTAATTDKVGLGGSRPSSSKVEGGES